MVFNPELDVLTTALVLEEYKLKRLLFLQCEGGMIDGYQPYPG